MDRRHFLMSSALAAGSVQASSLTSANDTIRVACVGLRGRGRDHINAFAKIKNVEIVALCDVDDSITSERLKDVEKLGLKRPATFRDIRKVLEDKSIDAISIASPNHWHTLMAIWAMQAGKDVYCEKPCSHNIFESQQIVAATKKYNRIVQHGSQTRSSPSIIEAFKQMNEGLLGDVYLGRGLCYKPRVSIGKTPVEAVPAGVDYDLWTGPAPKREFTKNRFHYNWHWFWDTGNGDFGNQGIHEVDICRWGLGVTYPTKISATGGKVMFDDDQETPNVLDVNYEFDMDGKKKFMSFEVRHWYTNSEAGSKVGNVFYGSKGYMAIDWYEKAATFLGEKEEPGPVWTGGGNHYANFMDAVRSRKTADLHCPIEEGAISCVLMHLGNIAYRTGRTLYFDRKTMSIVGDKEANAMFTHSYRKPFVVPENV